MKQVLQNKKKSFLQEATFKIFPLLKQEKTQSFFIIILTFLSLIIFGLFAINPTISTIIQLHKQLDDNTFVYHKLDEKITNIISLQKKYNALQPDLPIVFAAIPDMYNISQLFGQIQQLATENKLTIISMQSNPITINPIVSKDDSLSFTFSIKGNKQNILHFISSFMLFERITTIDEISLSTSTSQNTIITQAKIQAKVFFKSL